MELGVLRVRTACVTRMRALTSGAGGVAPRAQLMLCRPTRIAVYGFAVSPNFRRSQAHECLIDHVWTGRDGAGRVVARKAVGTRLWACRRLCTAVLGLGCRRVPTGDPADQPGRLGGELSAA